MYQKICKPFFDFVFALIGLVFFSPVFVIVILLLFISNRGQPFFFQFRPGKNQKIFKIFKFKTMNDKQDAFGNLLSDAERLTKIGAFVRKTSLDEIPQLWNVVKGEMSFIGPRPLLADYLPLYAKEQNKRHLVVPGITGWAQVNGRNAISWGKKFELDVWYVNHQSFQLDVKILFETIKKVVKKEGINALDGNTKEPFNGHN